MYVKSRKTDPTKIAATLTIKRIFTIVDVGCLSTHPLQHQYRVKDTGEAFTNPNPDSSEAYGESLFNQTANAMALGLF